MASNYRTRGILLSRPYSPMMISGLNWKRSMSTSSSVPFRVYLNPDKEKDLIVNENKGRTGVYRWVHIESGKSYIGSSNKLNIRFKQYFNYNHISYPKRNLIIYNAVLKYGYVCLSLEILEYCKADELLVREQYYLDIIKPEYNILTNAYSLLGFKHSPENIAKFKLKRFHRSIKIYYL